MEDQKQRVYDALNKMGIKYEVVEHEPVHTMEDMDRLGLPEKGTLCKNLFLRDSKGKRHFLITADEKTKEFFIDKNLSRCKSMGIHPLENTATVFISFKDLDKFLWNLDVDVVKIKL